LPARAISTSGYGISVQWPGSLLRPTTSGFSQSFTIATPPAASAASDKPTTAVTTAHFPTIFDISKYLPRDQLHRTVEPNQGSSPTSPSNRCRTASILRALMEERNAG
jgi:hypothetical protein